MAWAVPVIALAATVPQAAASVDCTPTITVLDGSFKCCANGNDKGMFLRLQINLDPTCIPRTAPQLLVLRALRLGNNLAQNLLVTWNGGLDNGDGTRSVNFGGILEAALGDVQSCPHYLNLEISKDGGLTFEGVQFATDNISGGSQEACAALITPTP